MHPGEMTRDELCSEVRRLRERVRNLEHLVVDRGDEGNAPPAHASQIEHRILASMREGVLISNQDHIILYANPAAASILGVEMAELVGSNELSIVPADQLQVVEEANARRARGLTDHYELCVQRPNGELRWVLVHASPIELDRTGVYTGALAVFGDITEGKHATDALRASRERYRNLIDVSPDAILATDLRGVVTLANRQAVALLDVKEADELIGAPLRNWILAGEWETAERAAFGVLRRGRTRQLQSIALSTGGRRRHVELSISLLRDPVGQPEGFLVLARDISALRLSEMRLQSLLDLNDMHDASRQEIAAYVLQQAVQLSESTFGFLALADDGSGSAQAMGLRVDIDGETRLLDHSSRQATDSPLWQHMAVRRCPWVVNHLPDDGLSLGHPSQHATVQRFVCVPVVDHDILVAIAQVANKPVDYEPSDVQPLRLLLEGMWRHLQRRETIRALEESEANLAMALKGADLGLWSWSARSRRFNGDRRWAEMLGLPLDRTDVDLPMLRQLIHPDDMAATVAAWRDHAPDTEEVVAHAFRVRGSRDAWRWIRIRGRVVARDKDSRPLRMAGTVQDITDERLLEERLRDASKLEAVGQLAGGIAHEFNNLMTIVNGYSQMALEALPGDHLVRNDLETIRAAGERAAGLTSQLLAFSRQQPLRVIPVDLNLVLEDATRMLRPVLGEDVILQTRFAADLGTVRADPAQIHQIVLNMATNARHAMPDGGRLTISTANIVWAPHGTPTPRTEAGTHVMVSIADTGHGMTPETIEHIYEPFFTTKDVGVGTGLGLSTVYGIVKQLGGEIDVESQVGVGTVFRLYFAVTDEPAQQTPTPSRDTLTPTARSRAHILVIEDDVQVKTLVVSVLTRSGYEVSAYEDPRVVSTLDSRALERVDLMLVDVVMPHMSGPELVDTLLARHPGIKTLYMTGYAELQGHGAATKGMAVILKPFSAQQLAQRIAEVLGSG